MAAGLYIHVPFCRRKCPYCNFYSIAAEPELLERYTQAVCRNLRHYACAEPVDTVYFGSHAVSAVSGTDRTDPGNGSGLFTLSPDTEVTRRQTLPLPPGTAAPVPGKRRKPTVFRGAVPFGQPAETGRLHTAQGGRDRCAAAAAGFDNLSCDLMLALPGQTPEELEQTIREMTRLPMCISPPIC
ncbi:MAG: hypothetical protein ACLUOF_09565 [Ruminococcus sp.]